MKRRNPQCFISYCHENMDRNLLEYLISWLKKGMRGRVDFFYDQDLSAGSNLDQFMANTLDVDVALMLFTPAYKRKVNNRIGGAYKEYSLITNRYWTFRESAKTSEALEQASRFEIMPAILSGSLSEAVPDDLQSGYHRGIQQVPAGIFA